MELVGVQRTGELRNALVVELHEAAAELVGAVLEPEHTVIQGGCAAGQLSASVLGGVCAVSGRSHAVGVLADAGHEEPDLAQIFFQGADAGHILAVGGLIDQLVVDLLLGVAVGELFQPAHDEIGRKALHQAQSGLKVVVGPGGREVERDVQLAGLELRSLLPDGAHHLSAACRQRLVAQREDVVNDGFIGIPGHGGVDEAVLHEGLAGGVQHAVGHLLCAGSQGSVVGRQGVQPFRQLAEAAVQPVGPVQQSQRTGGKLCRTRFQLRRTVQQLVHGIIQRRDAVGQIVEAVEVEDLIPLPQCLGARRAGQQDLRCRQRLHVGLHGHAVL